MPQAQITSQGCSLLPGLFLLPQWAPCSHAGKGAHCCHWAQQASKNRQP